MEDNNNPTQEQEQELFDLCEGKESLLYQKLSTLQADVYLIQNFLKDIKLSDLADVHKCLNPKEDQVLTYSGTEWNAKDNDEQDYTVVNISNQFNVPNYCTLNDVKLLIEDSTFANAAASGNLYTWKVAPKTWELWQFVGESASEVNWKDSDNWVKRW